MDMILPVRVERIIAELGHECSEGKGDDCGTVCSNPVMNTEIFDARQNKCDLFISRNPFRLKKIMIGVLEFHHDRRGDIPAC